MLGSSSWSDRALSMVSSACHVGPVAGRPALPCVDRHSDESSTEPVCVRLTTALVLAACSGDGDSSAPARSRRWHDASRSDDGGVGRRVRIGRRHYGIHGTRPGRVDGRHLADAPTRRAPSSPSRARSRSASAMPLTGGPAAAFGPVKDGFQLYLDYGQRARAAARLHADRRHP